MAWLYHGLYLHVHPALRMNLPGPVKPGCCCTGRRRNVGLESNGRCGQLTLVLGGLNHFAASSVEIMARVCSDNMNPGTQLTAWSSVGTSGCDWQPKRREKEGQRDETCWQTGGLYPPPSPCLWCSQITIINNPGRNDVGVVDGSRHLSRLSPGTAGSFQPVPDRVPIQKISPAT